jgi:hypothetical protein
LLIQLKDHGDFFFNLMEGKASPEIRERLQNNFSGCTVIMSENRGRDAMGFLRCLNYVYENDLSYSYYCFIHTKVSLHDGGEHIERMLRHTVGSKELFLNNINILNDNDDVGMIGDPDSFCVGHYNEEGLVKGKALIQRFGIKTDKCYFVGGTVFLVKSYIFDKYLKNIELLQQSQDELYENGMPHSCWQHAWERMFGIMVVDQEKKIVGIKNNTAYFLP